MKRVVIPVLLICASNLLAGTAKNPPTAFTDSERNLTNYFRVETEKLASQCLADIQTREDWTGRREEYRQQFQEMLGLFPWPERTDLKACITGKLEQEDFTVEKLHFQAS